MELIFFGMNREKQQRVDRDGPDARFIVRGLHTGQVHPNNFREFARTSPDFVKRYGERQLRRLFSICVTRWWEYVEKRHGKLCVLPIYYNNLMRY